MALIKDAAYFLNSWTPTDRVPSDKPAELYDTRPLSEMILTSETESSMKDSLILIENHWRPEWHKNGVQVPVDLSSELHKPHFRRVKFSSFEEIDSSVSRASNSLREDTTKKLRHRSPLYQIDDVDSAWLSIVNEERECLGSSLITVELFEKIMEALEHLSYVKMLEKIKALEAESLEFDENAKCDVCLSYEGEDDNELVFCDGCFLCVHQACYGIPKLPEGSWICRQCQAGVKSTTPCELCPNTGGAMKTNPDGSRWCHISCALWVPEVSFGSVDLMEPVVKLDSIPQARRRLVCCICRSRYGAPIQCSFEKCKVAFHVTCAFQSDLTMRQELVDKDVRLVSFCPRHSRKDQKHNPPRSPKTNRTATSKQGPQSPASPSNRGTSSLTRKERLLQLEDNFHKLVDDKELELWLNGKLFESNSWDEKKVKNPKTETVDSAIPEDVRAAVMVYWRLKRRTHFNQPLICPTPFHWRETANKAVETTKEALLQEERATAAVHAFEAFRRVRFGLDRSRLVVDMVLQRERRKLALFRRMSRIFEVQARLLSAKKLPLLSPEDSALFSTAHLGDSVYDNWNVYGDYCSSQNISKPMQERKGQITKSTEHCQKNSPTAAQIDVQTTKAEPLDPVLYTIPHEKLIVPEDIRQRLRSAIQSVENNPKHRIFFKENLREPIFTKPVIRDRLGKRSASTLSLHNDHSPKTVGKPSENGFPPPAKRFKRLSLKYSLTDRDSFSPVPVLTKFAMVKFANDSVEIT